MSQKPRKILKWTIPFAVLSIACATAGLASGCKRTNKGHTHTYQWTYEEGGTEHWKACPDDGVELEGSRGEHVFVAGECECGAHEPQVEKKYGSVKGTVKLHKLGGYDSDFSNVVIDMGDDVDPVFNKTTGEFTVADVEAGKNYTLSVTKPGYQSYSVSVQVEENQEVTIGGTRGIVLEYEVFGLLIGWDSELHDFSHVNEADPYIRFKENEGGKSFNVISNDSYTDVAATLKVRYGNSTHGWHIQCVAFRFEDGKHLAVRYRADKNSIEIANNMWEKEGLKPADTLFGSDAGLSQYGEKDIHIFNDAEKTALNDKGLDLTAVLKDGKLYVMFDGVFAYSYQLPDGYAEKKAQVVYGSFDPASNAIFNYNITEDLPALESALDIGVTQPEDCTECTVTAAPQKEKYEFGEQIELTFTAPEGYKLDTLTVNGEDKYNAVSQGKLTVTADRETIEIDAKFAKEEPVALNLTVKGKKLGTTANLAQGTEVTLSGIEDKFIVGADGKITGNVVKGRYTVSVDKYFSKEIAIDENTTEVTLEYDSFRIVRWDTEGHDLTHVNDAEPYVEFKGPGSSMNVVTKEQMYNEVSLSITLKTAYTTDRACQQGVILQFEDGKAAILNINTDGTPRLQFRPELFSDDNDLTLGLRTAFNSEWVEFKNVTSAEVEKYASDTGIKLTVQRRGAELYTFIDGVFKGKAELPEEYKDDKVGVGLFAYGAVHGTKWNFEVSESVSDITVNVTDITEDNAGGRLTISENVALGGTVTITVTPDATHVLEKLEISGGVTPEPGPDGTYTFVATEKSYTVKATFAAKPAQEAEADVSGIDLGNVVTALADDTVVTFTPESGSSVPLTVEGGKVSGVLLPGKYTVSVDGYHNAEVTVGADGMFEGLTDGIKFEKIILTFNKINEPEGNLSNAGFLGNVADDSSVASAGKILTTGNGSIYEWTKAEFDDVAMTVTIKKQTGEQGLIIKFHGLDFDGRAQHDVRVRIQEYTDNDTQQKHTKIQWMASGWFWGTHHAISDKWDFMDNGGENYAVPLSDALVTKYNGDGLKLTIARKGAMVYVLIDGEVYAAQMLDDRFAEKKVSAAFFAQSVSGNYEIPVEITTDVDALLAGKTDANGVMGVLGKWTVTENTLAVTGNGYAEFAPAAQGTRESLSVTLKDGSSTAGKKAQGVAYRFADGKWIAARMESSDSETYIQYADDIALPKLGGSLTGWGLVKNFDKSKLADGVALQMIRDGRYIYILLDGEVIDLKVLDAKYATIEGVMATTIEQGTGTAFAYEYKSGNGVTLPEKYAVTASFNGDAHGYSTLISKNLVDSGESVTLTINTANANTAWSWYPTEIKVNGVAIDFSTVLRESVGANRCKYTVTVSNITANTEIVITVGKGTQVNYDVTVNNAEQGSVKCDMETYAYEYYWNDLCTWTITAKEGYQLEKIVIGEGADAKEITEGWTQNGNVYTYGYTVEGDIKAVVHFKAAEGDQPGVNAVTAFTWENMGTNPVNLDSADYKYYEIYGETTTAQTGKNDLITQENVSASNMASSDLPATISGSGASITKGHAVNADGNFTFKIKVVKGMQKIQIFFCQAEGATITADYTMNGNSGNVQVASNGVFQMVKISLDTDAIEEGEEHELTVTVSSSADGLQCGSCGIRSTLIDNNAATA